MIVVTAQTASGRHKIKTRGYDHMAIQVSGVIGSFTVERRVDSRAPWEPVSFKDELNAIVTTITPAEMQVGSSGVLTRSLNVPCEGATEMVVDVVAGAGSYEVHASPLAGDKPIDAVTPALP